MTRVIVVFLLKKFYLHFSEQYVLKEPNHLCSDTAIIDNMNDCKASPESLKEGGYFGWAESTTAWPKGCYRTRLRSVLSSAIVYWNTHSSGSRNRYAQPICKKGK